MTVFMDQHTTNQNIRNGCSLGVGAEHRCLFGKPDSKQGEGIRKAVDCHLTSKKWFLKMLFIEKSSGEVMTSYGPGAPKHDNEHC